MTPLLILTAVLTAAAAAVSTLAGFGFGITLIPFLLLLYPPKTAVLLTVVVGTFGVVAQWLRAKHQADYRLVGLILIGGIAGAPLGGVILKAIDPEVLKLLVNATVLAAVALTLSNHSTGEQPPRQPGSWLSLGTGAAAGVLATATGQQGLPLAMFFTWTRWEKVVTRATVFAVLVPISIVGMVTLALQNTLDGATFRTGALLFPAFLVGMVAGELAFQRVSQRTFRQVMVGILAVSAGVGVVNAIAALFN